MTKSAETLLNSFRAYVDTIDAEIVRSFLEHVDWSMAQRQLKPKGLSCLEYLDRLAVVALKPQAVLIERVARESHLFHWGQTYTANDFGTDFIEKYGWLEVFGTRGHFINDRIAAGLLLLGPNVDYPDHHHLAEEVYIPLTSGAEWRKGEGAYVKRLAGEIIHHPSKVSHAMRTGGDPLLALYLWRGGPLAQKSVIGKATGTT